MNPYYLLAYLAWLTFGIGLTIRIVRLLKVPPQDRWRLYPLPGAWRRQPPRGAGRYPLHVSAVIGENLLLTSLRNQNLKLWRGSLALHLGFYLLVTETILTLTALALRLLKFPEAIVLDALIRYSAWGAYSFGLVGSVIILQQRLSRKTLRPFSTAAHYFNLSLLGALSATGLAWALLYTAYPRNLQDLISGMLYPATPPPELPSIGQEHIGLILFFLCYYPFTHMTHGVIRFFIRREVRQIQSRQSGGKLEAFLTSRAQREILNPADSDFAGRFNSNWNDTGTDTDHEK
jgi:nitrate reductase gamma subunit